MYSYDRTRTAAKTDAYYEAVRLVQRHLDGIHDELRSLLKDLVPYFRSIGFDINLANSYLEHRIRGSDGIGISGQVTITEREENNTVFQDPRKVAEWVGENIGFWGRAHKIKEGPETNRSGEKLITWRLEFSDD